MECIHSNIFTAPFTQFRYCLPLGVFRLSNQGYANCSCQNHHPLAVDPIPTSFKSPFNNSTRIRMQVHHYKLIVFNLSKVDFNSQTKFFSVKNKTFYNLTPSIRINLLILLYSSLDQFTFHYAKQLSLHQSHQGPRLIVIVTQKTNNRAHLRGLVWSGVNGTTAEQRKVKVPTTNDQ